MTGIFLRATAVTRGWNRYRNKSQRRKMTLEKKFSRLSCRDSKLGPFDHESDALTTELSLHPWPLLWAFEGVLRGALAYHNLLIAVRFVLIMDKLFHTIFACIFLSVLCDHGYFVLSWWIRRILSCAKLLVVWLIIGFVFVGSDFVLISETTNVPLL